MSPAVTIIAGIAIWTALAFACAPLIGRRLSRAASAQSIKAPERLDPMPVPLGAPASSLDVSQIDDRHAHAGEHGRNRLHHRQSVHVVAAGFHAANMSQR